MIDVARIYLTVVSIGVVWTTLFLWKATEDMKVAWIYYVHVIAMCAVAAALLWR